jgi:hypothetical protein
MTLPTSHHFCQGCAIGTTFIGWGGSARYQAQATPLACLISDKNASFVHQSQTMVTRGWTDERLIPAGERIIGCWPMIDDSGKRFN